MGKGNIFLLKVNHNSKNLFIFAAANAIGVWCSWLAFLHGVQAVARSSRATPTKGHQSHLVSFFHCVFSRHYEKRNSEDYGQQKSMHHLLWEHWVEMARLELLPNGNEILCKQWE